MYKPVSLCPFPADRASLQAASCVEKMQEMILDLLSRVCGAQAGAARGGPQRFGRLLGRLTELRTLRHNYLLLTRQQPLTERTYGKWWNPPLSSLGSFMFSLRTRWSCMSWEIVQKHFWKCKVFTWYWSDCWILWSVVETQFSQLTSVLQSLLNFSFWWDQNVFFDCCTLFERKIFYKSFYNCCIQLTCTLTVLFTMPKNKIKMQPVC